MILKKDKMRIKVQDDLINRFKDYRQLDAHVYEQGGMLIGSIIKKSNDIIIDRATFPMTGDYSNRINFIRSINHNRILKKIWKESNRTRMYFGEWHTHPQINPKPSSQDISNWNMLMRKSKTFTDNFLFIIIGTKKIGIWLANRLSDEIEKIY